MWGSFGQLPVGKGKGKNGGKGAGIKKYKLVVKENSQGDVKNNIGNGEAKELNCMSHEHELRKGLPEGVGAAG